MARKKIYKSDDGAWYVNGYGLAFLNKIDAQKFTRELPKILRTTDAKYIESQKQQIKARGIFNMALRGVFVLIFLIYFSRNILACALLLGFSLLFQRKKSKK